jgi:hypothetical protein
MMPRQPEGKLHTKIQARIKQAGGFVVKIHASEDSFMRVGLPDLLCCYRGRFVGLEVKMPGNTPTPVQKAVLQEIVSAGGYASVVSTLEQVDHLLAKIDTEVDLARGSIVRRQLMLDRSISRHGG